MFCRFLVFRAFADGDCEELDVEINELLRRFGCGFSPEIQVTPFRSEEDDSEYKAWKVVDGEKTYVLKQAKGHEAEIYRSFFENEKFKQSAESVRASVPGIYGAVNCEGEDYILMEYIEGMDLCKCDRSRLKLVLDALISLQDFYWETRISADIDCRAVDAGRCSEDDCSGLYAAGCSFADSLENRKRRGEYLNDPELEAAYEKYLEVYQTVPRTLCHDDLLPFNVLVSDERAVIIDWEIVGMLPYPTSLARLIAHCSEDENAFFVMSEDDKNFAVEYYYDRLVRGKGISEEEYRTTLDYFRLYEYCEWIMLGNRYEDADMDRFREYMGKAKELVKTWM